jgi:hypothetical protein
MSDSHHPNAEAGRPAVRDSVPRRSAVAASAVFVAWFPPARPDPTKTDESLREKTCPLALA